MRCNALSGLEFYEAVGLTERSLHFRRKEKTMKQPKQLPAVDRNADKKTPVPSAGPNARPSQYLGSLSPYLAQLSPYLAGM
jgi:hypothetical protein